MSFCVTDDDVIDESVLKNAVLDAVTKFSTVTPRFSSSSLSLKFIIPPPNIATFPLYAMSFVILDELLTVGNTNFV